MITEFRGKWTKLSNYSLGSVWYKDKMYPSAEHAYQAQKSADPRIQAKIRNAPTPNTAKKLARTIELRHEWEVVKVSIMKEILREKFSQEPERSILLSTGDEELIEGNWWGDKFWGQCPVGNGMNWLGKLLMEIRTELKDGLKS
jgi:ribA/ribD-fused uncharacterized protein